MIATCNRQPRRQSYNPKKLKRKTLKIAGLLSFSIGFPLAFSVKNFSNRLKWKSAQLNYMKGNTPQRFFNFVCLITYTKRLLKINYEHDSTFRSYCRDVNYDCLPSTSFKNMEEPFR